MASLVRRQTQRWYLRASHPWKEDVCTVPYMCAIIPRQSIQDGKANGTVSKDLRSSISRCSLTCIHSLSSSPSLQCSKTCRNKTVQFIPLLEKEKSLFWLLHPKKDMQIFMVENWFCNYSIWGTYTVFHQIKIRYFIWALVRRQFINFLPHAKCAHLSRPIHQLNDLFDNL